MNKNSNLYTFLYSIIMVVVVAVLLAVAYSFLKPYQLKNIEIDKKYNILLSVHQAQGADTVQNRDSYIENEYKQYITNAFAIDMNGNLVAGIDGFNVNIAKEISKFNKGDNNITLPVFECQLQGAVKKYIFPLTGKGLWGPIWGYISLNEDMNTISGVVFDHKGETPGLGAEITTSKFRSTFEGKTIFEGKTFTSIHVVKNGTATLDAHTVDGISGGTLTSKGVNDMLYNVLQLYRPYITKVMAEKVQVIKIDSTIVTQDSVQLQPIPTTPNI